MLNKDMDKSSNEQSLSMMESASGGENNSKMYNKYSLIFVSDETDKNFRRHEFAENLHSFRVDIILSFILVAIFGLWDAFSRPSSEIQSLLIFRYGVGCISFLLLFASTWWKNAVSEDSVTIVFPLVALMLGVGYFIFQASMNFSQFSESSIIAMTFIICLWPGSHIAWPIVFIIVLVVYQLTAGGLIQAQNGFVMGSNQIVNVIVVVAATITAFTRGKMKRELYIAESSIEDLHSKFDDLCDYTARAGRLVFPKSVSSQCIRSIIHSHPHYDNDIANSDRAIHYAQSSSALVIQICDFDMLTASATSTGAMTMLSNILDRMSTLARSREVERLTMFNDCVVYTCGFTEPHPEHACVLSALALDILSDLEALGKRKNIDLLVKIGIGSGEMYGGLIGRERVLFDAWGPAVDDAWRLCFSCEPGNIRVSVQTHDMAVDLLSQLDAEEDPHTTYELEFIKQFGADISVPSSPSSKDITPLSSSSPPPHFALPSRSFSELQNKVFTDRNALSRAVRNSRGIKMGEVGQSGSAHSTPPKNREQVRDEGLTNISTDGHHKSAFSVPRTRSEIVHGSTVIKNRKGDGRRKSMVHSASQTFITKYYYLVHRKIMQSSEDTDSRHTKIVRMLSRSSSLYLKNDAVKRSENTDLFDVLAVKSICENSLKKVGGGKGQRGGSGEDQNQDQKGSNITVDNSILLHDLDNDFEQIQYTYLNRSTSDQLQAITVSFCLHTLSTVTITMRIAYVLDSSRRQLFLFQQVLEVERRRVHYIESGGLGVIVFMAVPNEHRSVRFNDNSDSKGAPDDTQSPSSKTSLSKSDSQLDCCIRLVDMGLAAQKLIEKFVVQNSGCDGVQGSVDDGSSEIQAKLPAKYFRLSVGSAVHVGPVISGVIATDRVSYECLGETVNSTVRLSLDTCEGEVRLTPASHGVCGHEYVVDSSNWLARLDKEEERIRERKKLSRVRSNTTEMKRTRGLTIGGGMGSGKGQLKVGSGGFISKKVSEGKRTTYSAERKQRQKTSQGLQGPSHRVRAKTLMPEHEGKHVENEDRDSDSDGDGDGGQSVQFNQKYFFKTEYYVVMSRIDGKEPKTLCDSEALVDKLLSELEIVEREKEEIGEGEKKKHEEKEEEKEKDEKIEQATNALTESIKEMVEQNRAIDLSEIKIVDRNHVFSEEKEEVLDVTGSVEQSESDVKVAGKGANEESTTNQKASKGKKLESWIFSGSNKTVVKKAKTTQQHMQPIEEKPSLIPKSSERQVSKKSELPPSQIPLSRAIGENTDMVINEKKEGEKKEEKKEEEKKKEEKKEEEEKKKEEKKEKKKVSNGEKKEEEKTDEQMTRPKSGSFISRWKKAIGIGRSSPNDSKQQKQGRGRATSTKKIESGADDKKTPAKPSALRTDSPMKLVKLHPHSNRIPTSPITVLNKKVAPDAHAVTLGPASSRKVAAGGRGYTGVFASRLLGDL